MAAHLLELALEDLHLAHLVDDRLVAEELDVWAKRQRRELRRARGVHVRGGRARTFGQVVRLGAPLELVARLARVNALEDAYLPEVLERELQLLQRLVARDVVRRVALDALRPVAAERSAASSCSDGGGGAPRQRGAAAAASGAAAAKRAQRHGAADAEAHLLLALARHRSSAAARGRARRSPAAV